MMKFCIAALVVLSPSVCEYGWSWGIRTTGEGNKDNGGVCVTKRPQRHGKNTKGRFAPKPHKAELPLAVGEFRNTFEPGRFPWFAEYKGKSGVDIDGYYSFSETLAFEGEHEGVSEEWEEWECYDSPKTPFAPCWGDSEYAADREDYVERHLWLPHKIESVM